MKRKLETKNKVKTDVYFPPFLKDFNPKKINFNFNNLVLEVISSPALKLLEKVSFDNETTSETIVRIVENYLLLISLAKIYQMIFYDALEHKTHSRLIKVKPDFIKRFSGYNTPFIHELDELLANEIENVRYQKMIKIKVEKKQEKIPIVSNDLVLPVLNDISYDRVLLKMVEEGVFPAKFIKNLSPKNEYGLLAITTYKATMKLIEAELRKMISQERLKMPPKSFDEFLSRLVEVGENL